MRAVPTAIPDVLLLEPVVHRDPRGFLLETYHAEKYREVGIAAPFVQDNHSRSAARTLRGLHAQLGAHAQGKLVRALRGEVFDVAVDVRRNSPTFRRWIGARLSDENFHQLWVPPGFLHGFCVLSDWAEVAYKCTELWNPADEISVRWDDPDLGIVWPTQDPLLSPKDAAAPLLADLLDRLPQS
jgi:dTDP-4-dehydrorhamnose 3,5-epimerase